MYHRLKAKGSTGFVVLVLVLVEQDVCSEKVRVVKDDLPIVCQNHHKTQSETGFRGRLMFVKA